MSYIEYNNIKISMTRLREFSSEPVMSDDGTEVLYVRRRLAVDGVLNPAVTSYAEGPEETPGELAIDTHDAIYRALMSPRRKLRYVIGGRTALESPDGDSESDPRNGPTPLACVIHKIAAIRTWMISFSIETYSDVCESDVALVSSRHEQRMSTDEDHFSVITTVGVTRFRADLLKQQGLVADAWRAHVLGRVPRFPGYKRVGVDVGVSPDGLTLAWQVVDREQAFDVGDLTKEGKYITRVEAGYTIGPMMTPEGFPTSTIMETFEARINGNKYSSVWSMVLYGIALAAAKMDFSLPLNRAIPRDWNIYQGVTRREVSFRLTRQLVAAPHSPVFDPSTLEALRVIDAFGDRGGANPSFPNASETRGTDTHYIMSDIIRRECEYPQLGSTWAPPPSGGDYPDGVGSAPVNVFPIKAPPLGLAAPPSVWSDEAKNRLIPDYKIDTSYEVDEGIHQMKVGGEYDDPPEILTLWSRSSRKVVRWTAETVGGPSDTPNLPAPYPASGTTRLAASSLAVAGTEGTPDGSASVHRVSGKYEYVDRSVEGAGDEIVVDRPDTIAYPRGTVVLPREKWVHGISGPPTGGY